MAIKEFNVISGPAAALLTGGTIWADGTTYQVVKFKTVGGFVGTTANNDSIVGQYLQSDPSSGGLIFDSVSGTYRLKEATGIPKWVWIAIPAALIGGWFLMSRRKNPGRRKRRRR